MSLKNQRRIAAHVIRCSPYRVVFDPSMLSEIKEAITKADIRGLISRGAISEKPVSSIARGRIRRNLLKKSKGKRRGHGSRKGTYYARAGHKKDWMNRIRSQRTLLLRLREEQKIDHKSFRSLYSKAKGGFFRSVRHIRLYIDEQGLIKK